MRRSKLEIINQEKLMRNKTMNKPKSIVMVFAVMLMLSGIGNAINADMYGGIVRNATNPPDGTTINLELSNYYKVPTATGNDNTYWFIGGYGWFNQTEMMNLPSDSLMYDISPYALSGGSNNSSHVLVPISIFVIAGFIVFVIYKRRQ